MKILQVSAGRERIPVAKGGGIETVIFNISKYMSKCGEDITILDRKRVKEEHDVDYIDNLKIIRLSSIQFKLNKKIYFISTIINELIFAFSVNRYMKKTKSNFDIIHLHDPFIAATIILFNKSLRKNILYTTHQSLWTLESPSMLLKLIYIRLDKFIISRIKYVSVPNDRSRLKIVSVTRLKNIVTIPNGVDIDVFNPYNDTKDFKERFDIKNNVNILFVGRFHRTKGIEYLMKAASIIINKYSLYRVRFLLVGSYIIEKDKITVPVDDSSREIFDIIKNNKIEKYVKIIGTVSFDDLKKFYTSSDIFVLPSISEIFGLTLAEAMASGKPLVATNIAGPSIQIRDGWNGFLVEPANEIQLAEKIKYLIDYPEERKRMGTNSRKFAETTFDWRNVANMYLNIYNIIGEKR